MLQNIDKFLIKDTFDKIEEKKATYLAIIEKAFNVDREASETIYIAELETYIERLKFLYNSSKKKPSLSVMHGTNIFLEVMTLGISFSSGADHIYLLVKKGQEGNIGYSLTVRGEIFLATRSGAISHVSPPVVIRKDTDFSVKTDSSGRLIPVHETSFDNLKPFTFDDFKAGYCWVVFSGGNRELFIIDHNRMSKYRSMSDSPSMYDDLSFIETKIVKRSLHNINKTSFVSTQLQILDDDEMFTVKSEVTYPTSDKTPVNESSPVIEQKDDTFNFNF